MRLLMNAVLETGHALCAVFSRSGVRDSAGEKAGEEKEPAAYRYVIGSRALDMRAVAKEFNAAFDGRGGGKPEMVQGTARGIEEEIKAWILEKAEGMA